MILAFAETKPIEYILSGLLIVLLICRLDTLSFSLPICRLHLLISESPDQLFTLIR